MGVSNNVVGLSLAMVSGAFIGASFILKKKGLRRAGKSGTRAGSFENYIFQLSFVRSSPRFVPSFSLIPLFFFFFLLTLM